MHYLEIGNSTLKLAHDAGNGALAVERFADRGVLARRLDEADDAVVFVAVGEPLAAALRADLARRAAAREITRGDVAEFVGDTYDTPLTLGLDRALNLIGLGTDALVVSCGTAITIDALVGGRPAWGAIMPGFATAAEGLHARIAALPRVGIDEATGLPARTSDRSVANGVLLATAWGARAIAMELARAMGSRTRLRTVLTGGDAAVMARLWSGGGETPVVDDALLFRGMRAVASGWTFGQRSA